MGRLFEGFGILHTDYDHMLEKSGNIIQGRTFFVKIQINLKRIQKVRVRVRVRSSKIEVRCGSACGSIIEVRVCVRHTVKFLATQHLEIGNRY